MTSVRTAGPANADPVLGAAVDLARAAAAEVAGAAVDGEYLGVRGDDQAGQADGFVVTHAFAASVAGYAGWYWAVSLARAVDSEHVTVDEVVLLPGDGALLAPVWVPWDERLRPGDLGPGDLLPARADDPRLVPAYASDDDENAGAGAAVDAQIELVAWELGLGRERVLSRDGRLDAADRWHTGDRGPGAAMARQAPAHCGTCGFLVPLAGSLRAGFGVCGNEITDTDGQVVSVEYGCGAHSEVKIDVPPSTDTAEIVYDDGDDIEPRAKTSADDENPADLAVDESTELADR